ncbi:putative reverse transcriptase, RNA-dependent DNA polymerase [Plasmopara halstedii]
MNTIPEFLAMCCQRQLSIRQFDIDIPFLNGNVEKVLYMEPSEEVQAPAGMVCQLRGSPYGLK